MELGKNAIILQEKEGNRKRGRGKEKEIGWGKEGENKRQQERKRERKREREIERDKERKKEREEELKMFAIYLMPSLRTLLRERERFFSSS